MVYYLSFLKFVGCFHFMESILRYYELLFFAMSLIFKKLFDSINRFEIYSSDFCQVILIHSMKCTKKIFFFFVRLCILFPENKHYPFRSIKNLDSL